ASADLYGRHWAQHIDRLAVNHRPSARNWSVGGLLECDRGESAQIVDQSKDPRARVPKVHIVHRVERTRRIEAADTGKIELWRMTGVDEDRRARRGVFQEDARHWDCPSGMRFVHITDAAISRSELSGERVASLRDPFAAAGHEIAGTDAFAHVPA